MTIRPNNANNYLKKENVEMARQARHANFKVSGPIPHSLRVVEVVEVKPAHKKHTWLENRQTQISLCWQLWI